MLRLISQFALYVSDLLSDLREYDRGISTWKQIRARRDLPPMANYHPTSTVDRPFGLPPDVDEPHHRQRGF